MALLVQILFVYYNLPIHHPNKKNPQGLSQEIPHLLPFASRQHYDSQFFGYACTATPKWYYY